MKSSCLITIGNELLCGHTVDTNAAYLGRRLQELGVPVIQNFTVGDEIAAITSALRLATASSDVVILTGGLGPTDDDLTRQGLAAFLGVDLVQDDRLLEQIQRFFAQRNREMPARNAIQAQLPAGAEPIDNPVGTAPGIHVQVDQCRIFSVPGVPSEMRHLFEYWIVPRIEAMQDGQVLVVRRLHCFGIGESSLAERLGSMMQRGRNPLINCTVHFGVITLHIVASASTRDQAEALAGQDETTLRERLGSWVFGTGDQTLAEVVVQRLADAGLTLAVAESCTGGWIGKMLTDIPGASVVFNQGWITYSNEAKIRQLGVEPDLLTREGAVSEAVAWAMAQGARQQAGTDVAIATTGIAGPAGETPTKPVGLVYVALATQTDVRVLECRFKGVREMIRWRSTQTALDLLRTAALF